MHFIPVSSIINNSLEGVNILRTSLNRNLNPVKRWELSPNDKISRKICIKYSFTASLTSSVLHFSVFSKNPYQKISVRSKKIGIHGLVFVSCCLWKMRKGYIDGVIFLSYKF